MIALNENFRQKFIDWLDFEMKNVILTVEVAIVRCSGLVLHSFFFKMHLCWKILLSKVISAFYDILVEYEKWKSAHRIGRAHLGYNSKHAQRLAIVC